MAAFPVQQARKRREQFWLAGYVVFFFLIGSEQQAKIYFSPLNAPF